MDEQSGDARQRADGTIDDKLEALRGLQAVVERLRGPDGCPWDREQTLDSMSRNFLEEACEVIDAVESSSAAAHSSSDAVCEELGDLLMNIFLAARIAEEEGGFDLARVARTVTTKLIRRHPHVFGDASADTSDEVRVHWERVKTSEKRRGGRDGPASTLDGVPRSLPPLAAAFEYGRKAARTGFDWPEARDAISKVREELREVEASLDSGSPGRIEDEIGDLLLAVVNVSRKLGILPDRALRRANERFCRRFRRVEDFIEVTRKREGRTPSLDEMEEQWQQAKRQG